VQRTADAENNWCRNSWPTRFIERISHPVTGAVMSGGVYAQVLAHDIVLILRFTLM